MATVARDTPRRELPTPDDHPGADVVIFDGNCRFCRGQAERLARFDGRGRLAFLSMHDPRVAIEYPDLKRDALMEAMVVVDGKGRRHWGAASVRYFTRRLPRLWPLAPLLHIPGSLPLWRWLYRQVASRRYRLAGATNCDDGQCRMP